MIVLIMCAGHKTLVLWVNTVEKTAYMLRRASCLQTATWRLLLLLTVYNTCCWSNLDWRYILRWYIVRLPEWTSSLWLSKETLFFLNGLPAWWTRHEETAWWTCVETTCRLRDGPRGIMLAGDIISWRLHALMSLWLLFDPLVYTALKTTCSNLSRRERYTKFWSYSLTLNVKVCANKNIKIAVV